VGEARSIRDFGIERLPAENAVTPYAVWQSPTGKAGVFDQPTAASAGDYVDLTTIGTFYVTKASGWVGLKGNRVYWDRSAGNATFRKVNDRDFYVGRIAEDATSGAPVVAVTLNEDPPYDLDIARDPFLTTIVGTQALGGLSLLRRGGAHHFVISTTNEAQKLDAISVDGFTPSVNAIIELAFRVPNDGAGTVVDVNVGVASGTHATDADSIAEHLFVHLDANNTNINLQSNDGTTTVAATDTTTDYTEGSAVANRVEVWLDMRDPADVQCYVNGALVLASTVFNLGAAVGPLFLLAHVEKTVAADAYEFALDWLRAHYAEQ